MRQLLQPIDRWPFDWLRHPYRDSLERGRQGCDTLLEVGHGFSSTIGRLGQHRKHWIGIDCHRLCAAELRGQAA